MRISRKLLELNLEILISIEIELITCSYIESGNHIIKKIVIKWNVL